MSGLNAASSALLTSDPRRQAGAIRTATASDLHALARLFAAAEIDSRSLDTACGQPFGHLLVFEVGGMVRAVANVVIDPEYGLRARLELLVVDPATGDARRAIELRLIEVVTALCEAYGCVALDITSNPQIDETATHRLGLRGRS